MPTNIYGPGDNYHPENSHVFASLIRKFIIAKKYGHSAVNCLNGTPFNFFILDLGNVFLLRVGIHLIKMHRKDERRIP